MKPAGFSFDQISFPIVSVRANSDFDHDSDVVATEPEISIHMHGAGQREYHIGIRLWLMAEVPSDRYSIEMMAIGSFTAGETHGDEDDYLADEGMTDAHDISAAIVAHSGPNIVYGALRDMVANITSRGPLGEYLLQPKILGIEDFSNSP